MTSTDANLVVDVTAGQDEDGPLLARERVTHGDLLMARDETWWQGVREGALPSDLRSLTMRPLPGESQGRDRVDGFLIELSAPDGRTYRRHYGSSALDHVARRPVARLVEQKQLSLDDEYRFHVSTIPGDEITNEKPGHGMRATARTEPLVFEDASLAEYMKNSEPMPGVLTALLEKAESKNRPMPIFASGDLWDEGNQLARRGGEQESAGVWTGRLMRDTDSPEVFLLLDACIEAEHATEEKYAVEFSGDTWGLARERLEIRRRHLNRPHEIIVGSVHGHNFMPEADAAGNRRCEACPTAEICSRTTASASAADLNWHRIVFAGLPFGILTVWGWNAREEEEWRQYGLGGATLTARSIRCLNA